MSATIDERVVQMKFDNKDFEKNVATSLSTLDKLKNALTFTKQKEEIKTLADVVSTTKFDGMAASIDAIQDKMSGFAIFGKRIIENLADDFFNFTKNVISAIPNQIAEGGWNRALNVEDAKFTLKGLGVAWEEVSDDIDHAVLGTAYGADEAAKAAAQLAASGVQFGGVIGQLEDGTEVYSDMGRALRGISGVASMTHSNFSEIAHIFTTVAGQGKVMTEQLRMLESRGLNVAATMADLFGTTEEEVRDMVTHGEIDFQMFADAMDIAFGEHATDANETFEGSMANMKSALSRIGQDFAQTILRQTPQVFNSLKEFFNSIRKYTKPFADNIFTPLFTKAMTDIAGVIQDITSKVPDMSEKLNWFFSKSSLVDSLKIGLEGVYNIFKAMASVIVPVAKAFLSMFNAPSLSSIANATSSFKEFTEGLILTEEQQEKLYNVSVKIFEIIGKIANVTEYILTHTLAPIIKVIKALVESVIKIGSAFGRLYGKFSEGSNSADAFIYGLEKGADVLDTFTDLLVLGIEKVTDFIVTLIDERIYKFIENIKTGVEWIKQFNEETGLITNTFKVLGGIIAGPFILLGYLVSKIVEFTKTVYNMPAVQAILQKVFSTIEEFGSKGYEKIKEFITYLSTVDIEEAISNIKIKVEELWETVKNFFNDLMEKSEVINRLKESFSKIVNTFSKFKSEVSDAGLYDNYVKPLSESVSVTDKLKDTLIKAFEKIKAFFATLDTEKVIALTFVASMTGMVISVWKLVSSFTNLTNAATGTIGSIKNVANAIRETVLSYKKADNKSKFEEVAKGILMIVASLAALVYLDVKYHDNLMNACAILGVIAGGLLVFAGAMAVASILIKKIGSWESLAALDGAIIALAAGAFALSGALLMLKNIDMEQAQKGIIIIGEIATLLTVLSIIVSRFSGGGLRGFLTMLSFALVIGKFAEAIKVLAEVPLDNISENLDAMIVIFAGLAALSIAASHIGTFSAVGLLITVFCIDKIVPILKNIFDDSSVFDKILKCVKENIDIVKAIGILAVVMLGISALLGNKIKAFGTGMIMIGAALILTSIAMKILGSMDISTIKQGTKTILEIMSLFGVLTLLLSITHGGKNAIKVALAINLMTLALYPLAGAIWILGTMDASKVTRGTLAVAAILACFALIVAASNIGEGKASFASILTIVSGTVLLVGELIVLTTLPLDDIRNAVLAMCSVMLSLALLMVAVAKLGNTKDGVFALLQLIAIGALLWEVGMIIEKLCHLPTEGMIAATISLAGVMLAIGIVMGILGKIDFRDGGAKIAALAIIAIDLLTVGVMLYILASQPWDQILGAATGIAEVLLAMAAVLYIIGKVAYSKDQLKAVGLYLLLLAAVGAVAFALYELCKYDYKAMLGAATAIAEVLLAMAAVYYIITKVPIAAAIDGALALVIFLAIIAVVAIMFGEFAAQLPDVVYNNIMTGLERMTNIMASFGNMVGEFIGGVLGKAANRIMTEFGTGLSNFAENSKPFIETMRTVDADVAKGALNLATAMTYITASELLNSIANFLSWGKGAEKLSGTVTTLGNALESFADATSGIDAESVAGAADAASKLFSIKVPKTDGILQMYLGKTDYSNFSEETMRSFGAGIAGFVDAVKDIGSNDADGGIDVANKIFALDPPNEGGVLGYYLGDNVYSNFDKDRMGAFACGLLTFANSVKSIDTTGVDAACNVANKIFNLDPPNEGGLLAYYLGDNTYENFNAARLGDSGLGGGIAAFIKSVAELTSKDIEKANTASSIFEVLDTVNVSTTGGLFNGIKEFFAGKEDQKLFISNIATMGGAIAAFGKMIQDLPAEAVEKCETAASVIKVLSDISIPENGGIFGGLSTVFKGGDKGNQSDFISTFEAFGKAITAFYTNISEIDMEDVLGATTVILMIQNLLSTMEEFDTTKITGFTNAMQSAGNLGIEEFCNALTNSQDRINTAIDTFINNIRQAIENRKGEIESAVSSVEGTVENGFLSSFEMSNKESISGVITKLTNNGIPSSVAKAIVDNSGKGSAIWDGASGIVKDVTGGMKEGFGMSSDTSESSMVREMTNHAVPDTIAKTLAKSKMDKASLLNPVDQIKDTITGKDGFNIENGISSWSSEMIKKAVPDSFANGLVDQKSIEGLQNNTEGVFKSITKEFEGSDCFNMTGGANGYSQYIDELSDNAVFGGFENSFTDDTNLAVFSTGAEGMAGALGDAFESQVLNDEVAASAGSVATTVNDAWTEGGISYDNGEKYGKNMLAGLYDGLNDSYYTGLINSRIDTLNTGIDSNFTGYWDMHSPSKRMEEYGEYLVEGLCIGLDENQSTVYYSGEGVSDALTSGIEDTLAEYDPEIIENVGYSVGDSLTSGIDIAVSEYDPEIIEGVGKSVAVSLTKGFSSSLDGIDAEIEEKVGSSLQTSITVPLKNAKKYVGENLDIEPTIKPSIDTSDMRKATDLNNMLTDSNVSVDAQLSSLNSAFEQMANIIREGDEKIVSELVSIKEKVYTIQEDMGNLQVVMDTGALVGSLTPGIDYELGQMAKYKRRGM